MFILSLARHARCTTAHAALQDLVAGDVAAGVVGEGDGYGDAIADGFAVDGEALTHGHDDFDAVLADPAGVGCQQLGRGGAAVPHADLDGTLDDLQVEQAGSERVLRALVTSSLTTSCTMPMARFETGSPWTACTQVRKVRAMSRATAISSLPSNPARTMIGRSTSGSWPSSCPARSIDPPRVPSTRASYRTIRPRGQAGSFIRMV